MFVQVADSILDDFDLIEFLEELCAHCVSLLDVSAVGILLADEKGLLHTIAASDQNTHLLELSRPGSRGRRDDRHTPTA
ncbi:hypothetical protein [Streptomyces sp. NPDC051657]|uniref:hypothetical protein n=1 Tax=unclassified Streptomyces TaxID=2593676 RepID=UPI00342681AA